ncbi:response regulator [Streptomyces sp. NPDC079020]|uniref:response regulator n=1 Tax=Streptomyces sp. NPDC079020 TaxID=3365722 RepID=UPI0037D5B834
MTNPGTAAGTGPGASAGPPPPRVLIADDQALVRTGFRLILTMRGIDVVGEAADGAEAVEAARLLRPDVVLMDIRMPVMDGLEATRRVLAQNPRCRVLILTTFDLDRYVYGALSLGASGFLLKDVTPEHLAAAVRLVDTGDALLAPSITRRLVERYAAGGGSPGRPGGPAVPAVHRDLTALTPREREVLTLMGRGLSNAELAGGLTLSEATVKTHVARIFAKLGLRDRAQAVVLAYETGLVSAGDSLM